MARDAKQPLHFDLPDNDEIEVIPWEFVVDKCETILSGINASIDSIRGDLFRIDTKVKEWIE